jgi:hypothetical protein
MTPSAGTSSPAASRDSPLYWPVSAAPSRLSLVATGLWLLVVGLATTRTLNTLTDNAYLWLIVLAGLAPSGALFLCAAATGGAARRWLWRIGSWILWAVGAIGVPLLGLGFGIVLIQQPIASGPLLAYAAAFLGLLLTLYAIAIRPLL